MITDLGKELRKLRVDRDERIADMAAKIGKSVAFISAVETGRKKTPVGFEDAIIDAYDLPGDVIARLRSAANASRSRGGEPIDLLRELYGLIADCERHEGSLLAPEPGHTIRGRFQLPDRLEKAIEKVLRND